MKYSTNPKLEAGYSKQLAIYNAAERAQHSIYLIIRASESAMKIEALQRLREKEVAEGRNAPDIIVVDGRLQPSASKA